MTPPRGGRAVASAQPLPLVPSVIGTQAEIDDAHSQSNFQVIASVGGLVDPPQVPVDDGHGTMVQHHAPAIIGGDGGGGGGVVQRRARRPVVATNRRRQNAHDYNRGRTFSAATLNLIDQSLPSYTSAGVDALLRLSFPEVARTRLQRMRITYCNTEHGDVPACRRASVANMWNFVQRNINNLGRPANFASPDDVPASSHDVLVDPELRDRAFVLASYANALRQDITAEIAYNGMQDANVPEDADPDDESGRFISCCICYNTIHTDLTAILCTAEQARRDSDADPSHAVCRACLNRYLVENNRRQDPFNIVCPDGDCGSRFTRSTLNRAFSQVRRMQLEDEGTRVFLESLREELINCPHCDIAFAFEGRRDVGATIGCPSCAERICRRCQQPEHAVNEVCPADRAVQEAALISEDERFVRATTRPCPSCSEPAAIFVDCAHATLPCCRLRVSFCCGTAHPGRQCGPYQCRHRTLPPWSFDVFRLWRALGGVVGDNLAPLEAYFEAHPDRRPHALPRNIEKHRVTDEGANSVYFYHPLPGEIEAIEGGGAGAGQAALMPPPV